MKPEHKNKSREPYWWIIYGDFIKFIKIISFEEFQKYLYLPYHHWNWFLFKRNKDENIVTFLGSKKM